MGRLRDQVRQLEDARITQAELRDKAESELKQLQQRVNENLRFFCGGYSKEDAVALVCKGDG